MWCDILNNPKQGSLYSMDHSHLMNVPVFYDDKVECKSPHPALLDTKQNDGIKVTPNNQNIPKADPSPVCRSVSGRVIEEVRWHLAQVPRRKGIWVTVKENVTTKKSFGEPPRKTSETKEILNSKKGFGILPRKMSVTKRRRIF